MSFSSAVRWEVGKMLSEVISLSDIAGTFLICPFSCGFQWVKKISAPPICLWARHISDIHTQLSSVFLHSQPFFFFPPLFLVLSRVTLCIHHHFVRFWSFLPECRGILSTLAVLNLPMNGDAHIKKWHSEVLGVLTLFLLIVFLFCFVFKDCWRSHLCLNICDLCAVFNWSSSYNTVKSFC